jgi:LacI family transcriptional regulator
MNKRVTIADVAQEAGVSMMTVSRAINDKGEISESTRQRILEIAKEMGFQPSGLARGLATQRTATVGLVVPDIANPFFALIARGIENVAYDKNYNVFLLNTDEDAERELAALNSLWEKQVDGLILCSSRLEQTQLLAWLERFPFVVLVNRVLETAVSGVCTVNVDDRRGAKQAVDHLIASGHKNIAYVAGPEYSLSSQKRLIGYQESLSEHNLPLHPELIKHCVPDTEGGYEAAMSLLNKNPEITAVFAFNDLTATGVLRVCTELKRQVPYDVEIIGVDDIPLASLVTPALRNGN